MMHRILKSMTDAISEKLGGNVPVAIDETFLGGKEKNMHKSKRVKGLNYSVGKARLP